MHRLQVESHLHPLIQRLPEPDDPAGAHADPCRLRGMDDILLVLHRVRRADLREIGRRRLDIAVDARDARLFQLKCLLLGNQPQRAAYFDPHLFSDLLHDIDDFLELIRIILIAAGSHQRETNSACFLRLLRCRQDLLLRQKAIHLRAGVIPARLRAELAIFLTMPASCIDDRTEIHRIPIELLTNLIGHRKQQHGILILRANEFLRFFLCDFTPIHDLLRQSDDFCASTFHDDLPFLHSFGPLAPLNCYLVGKYRINNQMCQSRK